MNTKLSQEVDEISNNFEDKPWTDNAKQLKEGFDINSINTPDIIEMLFLT